jgi:hypothetical protein
MNKIIRRIAPRFEFPRPDKPAKKSMDAEGPAYAQ